MDKVLIDFDVYMELLDERRNEFWVSIPDCVWDYAMEYLKECIQYVRDTDPKYIVDNLAVNGSWHEFDELRKEGEMDEELINRLEEDGDYIEIFTDEKIVLYSFGW